MNSDLALVLGIVLAVMSIPSMVSAYSDGRPPVVSGIVLVTGCAFVAYAMLAHPGGYALSDVPHVVMEVIARFWR